MISNYQHKGTPKEDENKPKTKYFLKVTPRGDETIESLSSNLSKLKNNKFSFGEFNDHIISSQYGIKPECGIVEFLPKSRDVYLFSCKYETCEQALDAAIKDLNKDGLDAVPFDLEKLVNNIKIKPSFKNDKGLFVNYSK